MEHTRESTAIVRACRATIAIISTRVYVTKRARGDSRPFVSRWCRLREHVNALGAVVHQPIEPVQ